VKGVAACITGESLVSMCPGSPREGDGADEMFLFNDPDVEFMCVHGRTPVNLDQHPA
jgi:hypothetical protein